MIKKRYLMLAAVLIVAALVGLAGWGYARPAIASSERAKSEQKAFKARNHADAERQSRREKRDLREKHGSSDLEGRDKESNDSDDSTTSATVGVTPTTAAPVTTTTIKATTTTTAGVTTTTLVRATTTTTQAPATTTTTVRPTTTTTQATTTTTAINAAPLFSQLCVSCHGPNGTRIGSTLTASQILTRITTGDMSSYASSLNPAQKSALATYVAGGGR